MEGGEGHGQGRQSAAVPEDASLARGGPPVRHRAGRGGAPLEEHQVTGPLSIRLLAGRLRMDTHGGTVTLKAGELAALDAGVAHAAEALEDAALLITVAMPSTIRGGESSASQGGTCDAPAAPPRKGYGKTA